MQGPHRATVAKCPGRQGHDVLSSCAAPSWWDSGKCFTEFRVPEEGGNNPCLGVLADWEGTLGVLAWRLPLGQVGTFLMLVYMNWHSLQNTRLCLFSS